MNMIFGQQAQEYYGCKIFSTLEATSEYLGIGLTEEDLLFDIISE